MKKITVDQSKVLKNRLYRLFHFLGATRYISTNGIYLHTYLQMVSEWAFIAFWYKGKQEGGGWGKPLHRCLGNWQRGAKRIYKMPRNCLILAVGQSVMKTGVNSHQPWKRASSLGHIPQLPIMYKYVSAPPPPALCCVSGLSIVYSIFFFFFFFFYCSSILLYMYLNIPLVWPDQDRS